MAVAQRSTPIMLQPGERTQQPAATGSTRAVKASAPETGGSLAILETTIVANGGPPLHVHKRTDEAFYVLEGTFTIKIGEEAATLSAGGFAFVPQGTPHAFKNVGGAAGRLLDIKTPGGWEQLTLSLRDSLGDDPDALRAAMEQHDEWVVGQRI